MRVKIKNLLANKRKVRGIAMAVAVLIGSMSVLPVNAKAVSDYKDVPQDAWYYPYVADISEKEIMTGLKEDVFGANGILSRGQFATILYRMNGSPALGYEERFPDVPDGLFYSIPAVWAGGNGIVTGYANGNFGPANDITREQMATMLYRYAVQQGMDTSAKGDIASFPDGWKVSGFASEAMQWAIGYGIISGNKDGTLAPQSKVSRAVCATMISRFLGGGNEGNGNGDQGEPEKVWVIDKEAWTEQKPIYEDREHDICTTCTSDLSQAFIDAGGTLKNDGMPNDEYQKFINNHLVVNDHAGYHSEWKPELVGYEEIQHSEEGHWEYR